jgi:ribonuclease P protein component
MTELLVTGAQRRGDEDAGDARIHLQSLTERCRSGSLPRHEEDLSTEEGQEKPHARLPPAQQVAGRPQRAEAAPGQGPQAAHAERAQEVAGRSGVRFGKAARLTLRREFLAVQARGRKIHSGAYVVLALRNELGRPRLGVTVSSRTGNAVKRNLVKRWVREAFRGAWRDLPAVDLVVIARPAAVEGGLGAAERALAAARAGSGR